MRLARVLTAILTGTLMLTGCAGFHPRPIDQTELLERTETQTSGNVTVTVAVPSIEESMALFDSKLQKKGIQPIWLEIRNHDDEGVWFFPYSVDPDYFPPLEVAWRSHRTWAGKTNRAIDEFFFDNAIELFIPAGETESGYVFVNLDRGTKYVPMYLVGDGPLREFEFFVEVPGFRKDYTSIDFQNLYAEGEIVDLDDEEAMRRWAESLPCCAMNEKGTKNGDPLNFVLIGSDLATMNTFLRAGWDETAALTTGSAMKTGAVAVFGGSYRYAPISPLFVLGRPQDVGLQKARHSVHQRNHLRLWLAPVTFRGTPVWIGQISRDIGSRLTTKTSTFTTHKIDPDVDDARTAMLLDLIETESLAAYGFVAGVGPSSPDDPRENLTGDIYFSDGLRMVFFLSEDPTPFDDVRYLEWEDPELVRH